MNDQFSNQKNTTGGTSGSTFRLNPSATEFVPKFATAAKPQPTHNNNNNNNRNNNNNNYRNQNNNYMGNQNDIDPIEMEARCEAVVEILQDERVREHLNPLMNGDNNSGGNNAHQQDSAAQAAAAQAAAHQQQQDFNECDDEEEMFEMMAMQEECRMEMMKFYIQSQNPELFSEIYHDVSYPDQPMKLNPTGVAPPVVSGTGTGESTSPSVSNSSTSETTDSSPTKSPKAQNDKDSAAAAENLNANAHTFVPNQLEQLNLNDDSTSKKD